MTEPKMWSLSERTFTKMFVKMNELRRSRILCDVILKCEDKEFYAHRVILSSCSDYFCAMFTNEVTYFFIPTQITDFKLDY